LAQYTAKSSRNMPSRCGCSSINSQLSTLNHQLLGASSPPGLDPAA
jgi:hypothetical protein